MRLTDERPDDELTDLFAERAISCAFRACGEPCAMAGGCVGRRFGSRHSEDEDIASAGPALNGTKPSKRGAK